MALHADRSGTLWFATTRGSQPVFARVVLARWLAVLARTVWSSMTTDGKGEPWLCESAHKAYTGCQQRTLARAGGVVFSQMPVQHRVHRSRRQRCGSDSRTGGVAVLDGSAWFRVGPRERDGLAQGESQRRPREDRTRRGLDQHGERPEPACWRSIMTTARPAQRLARTARTVPRRG